MSRRFDTIPLGRDARNLGIKADPTLTTALILKLLAHNPSCYMDSHHQVKENMSRVCDASAFAVSTGCQPYPISR